VDRVKEDQLRRASLPVDPSDLIARGDDHFGGRKPVGNGDLDDLSRTACRRQLRASADKHESERQRYAKQ
jgi:hypothetical protein